MYLIEVLFSCCNEKSLTLILAFSDDGCVILKTIVVTTLMKMTRPVQDAIANVQNRNSDVATTNVFRADGNVIMTMVKYFLNLLYNIYFR